MEVTDESDFRSAWHKVTTGLPSQAELLGDPRASFAQTGFFEIMLRRRNQVVWGRRGTGKTHLLRRLEQEYRERFDELRVIPVVVDGDKLRRSASFEDAPSHVVALVLYVEFLRAVADQLSTFATNQIGEPTFLGRFLPGRKSRTRRRARDLARSLGELLATGEVRFLPTGKASDEAKTLDQTVTEGSVGVSTSLTHPKHLGLKVSASAASSLKRQHETTIVIGGETILPFEVIIETLELLLKFVGDASVVVLFDEWSDVATDVDTQPILADAIKRTLSSVNWITLKLACIPARTRLSTALSADKQVPVGLQLGDDIHADVDLDTLVFVDSMANYSASFFKQLLARHVAVAIAPTPMLDQAAFDGFLEAEAFDGWSSFLELCQASCGVPREFLELFNGANQSCVSNGGKIKIVNVRRAAETLSDARKERFRADSSERRVLRHIYEEIVLKKHSYLFLVDDDVQSNEVVRNLWAERLLHRLPLKYVDPVRAKEYRYFQIDYGMCTQLLIADAGQGAKAVVSVLKTAVAFGSSLVSGFAGVFAPVMTEAISPSLERFLVEYEVGRQPGGDLSAEPLEIVVDGEMLSQFL